MLSLFLYLSPVTKLVFCSINIIAVKQMFWTNHTFCLSEILLCCLLAVKVMKGEFWTVLANCKLAVAVFTWHSWLQLPTELSEFTFFAESNPSQKWKPKHLTVKYWCKFRVCNDDDWSVLMPSKPWSGAGGLIFPVSCWLDICKLYWCASTSQLCDRYLFFENELYLFWSKIAVFVVRYLHNN